MDMVTAQGWAIFGAVMPMAISGLVSGIFQEVGGQQYL